MARRAKAVSKAKSVKAKSRAKARKPARAKSSSRTARKAPKPIDLYFWPTANGKKITIMLEECGLPYVVHPIDIAKGDQFEPEFLKISPNNRMPAIVDPDGPGGKPISIFESGAILQYLGRKTGKFYPKDERGRMEVDQWVFWQVGGLGPMGGQANHFRNYAPEPMDYAIKRYTDEVNRLFGVMNKRLADRPFLAGKYSIADMICYSWTKAYKRFGQEMDDFPNLKRWIETLDARPGVQRGQNATVENHQPHDMHDPKVRAVLFNQRAR
jgi:GST-like protein